MGEPFRVLPRITPLTEAFWTGGAHGELRILRCNDCAHWLHPPAPICPACLSRDVAPQVVSGRGQVHTFTLNVQPWNPTYDHPYAIAVVELDEQPGLRLTTNIVDSDPRDVRIGMRVEVSFVEDGGVNLPMFRPAADPSVSGQGAGVAP